MTTTEAEFSDADRAAYLASYDAERAPRGSHGVLISRATDPQMNPYLAGAAGRFVAEPVIDFAQEAIDKGIKARSKAVDPKDDWPLLWRVSEEVAPSD